MACFYGLTHYPNLFQGLIGIGVSRLSLQSRHKKYFSKLLSSLLTQKNQRFEHGVNQKYVFPFLFRCVIL
eukprot:m.271560 g.271560  ORF g.271560 m.271560 type:complete len:70 (+) comp40551_c0_seq10:46-255(+)